MHGNSHKLIKVITKNLQLTWQLMKYCMLPSLRLGTTTTKNSLASSFYLYSEAVGVENINKWNTEQKWKLQNWFANDRTVYIYDSIQKILEKTNSCSTKMTDISGLHRRDWPGSGIGNLLEWWKCFVCSMPSCYVSNTFIKTH